MSFDPNHMIFDSTDSQYVRAYHIIMSDFLLMSLLLTMPIFPKCANIGEVFWATVVEDAPYKVLLGQPLLTLLSANTQDHPDGGQDINVSQNWC